MDQTPKPTIKSLDFPTSNPDHFVHIISNLLTESECTSIIETHKNLTVSNVSPGTIRTRQQFDDEQLATSVWGRIRGLYEGREGSKVKDEDGQWWRVLGLNSRWRLCLYEKGGKFSAHCDGRRLAGLNEQSFMTVNIYLNNVPEAQKGATRFFSGPPTPSSTSPATETQVLAKAQPIQGSAAIFRDSVWHDGEELVGGVKYLLRTDVMYEREMAFDFERMYGELGEEEKARRMLRIAEGLEDAGKGGEAVGWYKRAYKLCPGLERGER